MVSLKWETFIRKKIFKNYSLLEKKENIYNYYFTVKTKTKNKT